MAVVTPTSRDRLDLALDRIGHQGKPAFRRRLAAALDMPAPVGLVVRSAASSDTSGIRWTPAELADLSRALKQAFERVMADPAAIDAANIAVGEVALTRGPDDPQGRALRRVQDGLDSLYAEATR